MQVAGCYMGNKDKTEDLILSIIRSEPGIRATDIAARISRTEGRVSQVVKNLVYDDHVERVRDKGRRGQALRPKSTWMHKRLIRGKWGQFRDKTPR